MTLMDWSTMSVTALLEQYGWYLLIGFLIYFFWGQKIKDKILEQFPTSDNRDPSKIPTKHDDRLHKIRAEQQQRLDKITTINMERKKHEPKEKSPPKLSAKQKKVKESAAYRYATTGKWGTDDDKGSGGMADAQTLPRYRPPSAFQRYGRRPGGGG